MPTLVEDIVIQQGITYEHVYLVTDAPGSITGFDARMQVRSSKSSTDKLVDWSVAGGQIIIDGVNNHVIVRGSSVETTAMTWTRGLYDIELVDDSQTPHRVWRLAEGAARLSKEVTR